MKNPDRRRRVLWPGVAIVVLVTLVGGVVVKSRLDVADANRAATRAEERAAEEHDYVTRLLDGRAELIDERDAAAAAAEGAQAQEDALREKLDKLRPLIEDADQCVVDQDALFQAALQRRFPTQEHYYSLIFFCDAAIAGLVVEINE